MGQQRRCHHGEDPETETYQKRFKGLVDLRKKGVTDIRNESEYLGLEREYRSVFREAGMRDFLGPDGTQTQFDAIAELVADYSVSVAEVRSRVNDAARVVADTSQETLDAMKEYYGLDMATLTEYVPVRFAPRTRSTPSPTRLCWVVERDALGWTSTWRQPKELLDSPARTTPTSLSTNQSSRRRPSSETRPTDWLVSKIRR